MTTGENAVAVIGMACRFPGAADVRAYWSLLRDGVEGISRFAVEDIVAWGADPQEVRHPDFVPAKGVLAQAENFDWSFFGYSRAEAASIDPQQRVFLECASAAIDDAGLDPTRFPGWIGVYAGADQVRPRPDTGLGELTHYIGQEKDFLATRVAYKLGLHGPALTVQTACSTSLTAVHLAAMSLRAGECDVALAGGVTVTPGSWGYRYEKGGILSPDGHCRPFDQHAAGTVPSEGVGVVVLKRLPDALRDRDRIVAVILGSALNNDGAEKIGYTAPSIPGQSGVIRYAQQVAGVDPADIDYVEAHATATRIGDPVEVQALTDVFQESTDATGFCRLGGVKSNLGHTGAAAGVAAFIKTALMLEHGEFVPTLHFRAANPLLDLDSTPFTISTAHQPWPDRGSRLAAVSAFGVGGTNAHVIVGGAPRRDRPAAAGGLRLLALSAASPDALDRLRRDLADQLHPDPPHPGGPAVDFDFDDVVRTLAGRRILRHRRTVVADAPEAAASALRDASAPPPEHRHDKVAFLFPGQGTLRHAAGAAAHCLLPSFRTYFDEIARTVRDRCARDLAPVVDPAGATEDWFTDTVNQQLGLFALGYALGRQLLDWGVTPAAMLGNSIGEYTAAALAGVWDPADATILVHERAQAMWSTKPGRMAAVTATADEIARRIGPDDGITIAVVGTDGVVLSGGTDAMERLLTGNALRGLDVRPLATVRAFHSPAMDPAAQALRKAVSSTPARAPRLRLISNTTGGWSDPAAVGGADYWVDQLRRPVLLHDGATTMLAAGCDVFVELGAGSSMTAALRRHEHWDTGNVTVPMLGRAGNGKRALLLALGTLWEHGVDQAIECLPDLDRALRCSLPGHPFAEQSPDQPATPPAHSPSAPTEPPVVAPPQPLRQVLAELWCATLGVASVADSDDFFALGGESLTAVNLMSRVLERTGLSISVTEFSQAPTFADLVRLAGPPQAPDTPTAVAGLVTLRPGAGRPLFLAADATGTVLGYRVLAGLLDGDRPVHGLEQTGEPEAAQGIEQIAAGHVEAVLRVQPDGPYTIGGWSFGAVVAHEMARQLSTRGAAVDLLVCLDGFVPPTPGQPVGSDPEFLAGTLRLRVDAALGLGLIGGQVRHAPALRQRFLTNLSMLLRYRPAVVPCPAVVFAATGNLETVQRVQDRLNDLYDGGVRVRPAQGDHWSMLAQPFAPDLATQLSEALSRPGMWA